MIQQQVSLVQRIRHLLGVDRAIAFTVMARSWTILSGALTLLLISRFLSVTEQGYYYTFNSLVQVQVVFELGFSFVVLQLAAHETSALTIGKRGDITGDPVVHSRLASLLQKSVRWYSVAAALMGMGLFLWGYRFFTLHAAGSVAWKLPWICIVAGVLFTFQMDPVFSFLEGCGFVAQVASMRLAQAVSGTIVAWLLLTQHHGLYAPAAIIAGQAVAGAAFLFSRRSLLWPLLRRSCGTDVIRWWQEIWPFQWRIALSFFFGYFIVPLFNPALFAYRGPAEAGRMGMSVSIAASLATVAYSWINTKASPFGAMVARRDFAALDRLFFRTLLQSGALLLAGDACVLAGLYFVERRVPSLEHRMLPLPVFALLMFAFFLTNLLWSAQLYTRAHKQDPFIIHAVVIAVLSCSATFVCARNWGATGVTVGYLICGGVLNLAGGSYIFLRKRRLWHADVAAHSVLKR